MTTEIEKLVSAVTESPAYKEAISNDQLMRLRNGFQFEGEILPDVLNRTLTQAYQAGIRRAIEVISKEETNKWDDAIHCTCLGACRADLDAELHGNK